MSKENRFVPAVSAHDIHLHASRQMGHVCVFVCVGWGFGVVELELVRQRSSGPSLIC